MGKGCGKRLVLKQYRQVQRQVESGVSIRQISEEVGCTRSSVYAAYSHYTGQSVGQFRQQHSKKRRPPNYYSQYHETIEYFDEPEWQDFCMIVLE